MLEFEYYPFIPIIATMLYLFMLIKRKSIFINYIDKEKFDNLTLLFIFSTVMTFMIIPIMNIAHFLMEIPFDLLVIFYFFDVILLDELFSDKKYTKNTKWIAILILFLLLARVLIYFFFMEDTTFIKDKNNHFFGIYIYNSIIEKSSELEKYILEQNEKGIEVMVLSNEAAYTMVNLEKSNGEYDLLFNGNMGYNGIESVKEDISRRKNTEFLIFTDEKDMFWQESKEIREFIQKNLTKKGEILNYTIYSTEK